MKKISCVLMTLLVLSVASCGIFNKGSVSNLYNKHNRERAKIKKGLFSSRRVSFGDFSTGSIKNGVDRRVISFGKQESPFHFTLSDKDEPILDVQALYTDKASLRSRDFPPSFNDANISKIFYAWISGSSANNLNNWELVLKNPSYQELAKNAIVGEVHSSNGLIEVHANDRSGKNNYDGLTYEFQLRGIPIAAVQVNGKRKYVWMDPNLNREMSFAVAGAVSALLLK